MIGAEIGGSLTAGVPLGYVEDARPRDTGAWRKIHPADPLRFPFYYMLR